MLILYPYCWKKSSLFPKKTGKNSIVYNVFTLVSCGVLKFSPFPLGDFLQLALGFSTAVGFLYWRTAG